MKFSMTTFGKPLKKMTASAALKDLGMKTLSPAMTNRALSDAGQVIINSTKAGYLEERGPGGEKWADNPEWYKVMKGGAAVLTGPTRKSISGGTYSGWEFSSINTRRMKNSLVKHVTSTKVTVEYMQVVKERAELTQKGGSSEMKIIKGSRENVIDVNVQARPHLGVAENWMRLGSKTDPEHIEEIFGDMIVTIT